MLFLAKRIVCNEKFEELLKAYLKSSGRTLAKEITEECMDEAFRDAKYDYSDVKVYCGSTKDVKLEKQPLGDAVNSNDSENKASVEAFTVTVKYIVGTELTQTKLSGWNITGGLSAEYHIGASAGVGYTSQQSESIRHIKGTEVTQAIEVKVHKGSKPGTVIRKLQRKECQVRNIKLSFPRNAQIKCFYHKKDPTKVKNKAFPIKDILKDCIEDGYTAKLDGKYVWVETEIVIE